MFKELDVTFYNSLDMKVRLEIGVLVFKSLAGKYVFPKKKLHEAGDKMYYFSE